MADIQFTSEIRVDTEQAKKDIQSLARQINDVFNKTGMMMSAALRTQNFGFSQYGGSYSEGIDTLGSILKGHVSSLAPLPKKATKAQKAIYAQKVAQIESTAAALQRLSGLSNYMGKLSKYDTLYSDIANLQDITARDRIDPAKGLGRYGTLQRYSNRFLGLLYGGNLAFPGIVGQSALELGEYYRDINRKTGSMNRSALRYVQDKKYSASSISRAGDYMLMTGEGGLDVLSDIYGLGLGTDATSIPGRVSSKAKDALSAWASVGLSANAHKEALLGGGLTSAQRAYHLAGYKEDMSQFIKLQKKLFPEEKAIAENLKKLNKSDLVKFGIGGGIGNMLKAVGGGAVLSKIVADGAQMMESVWGESITRSVYGSERAYYKRWQTGGQLAGIGTGAAIGAFAGPVAAAIGAAIGAILGPLYGKYKETKLESDIKSSNDMISRIRNKSMYGSAYNTYFANSMSAVTGGDGMAELAGQAMSLRARMMLGQVGEYDMLYYSMMPNYFAALMEGRTGPELARIYQNDLMAIGDPSMRYVVGQAIGGTNAYAMANNKYFDPMYNTFVGRAGQYEGAVGKLEASFMAGRTHTALQDIGLDYAALTETVKRNDPNFVISQYSEDPELRALRKSFGETSRLNLKQRSDAVTFINVIKLPDGTELTRDIKTADELYIDSWSQFAGE